MNHDPKIRFFIPFIYLLFIIYGSFIPFHIRSIPFFDALNQFRHIPFLDLGIVSRADWVANIILYLPLGFFLTGWVSKRTNPFYKNCFNFLVIFLFCILTATCIEFSQIFFSPRTVSLNDLIAETIGSISGIVLWVFSGSKLISFWFSARSNSRAESALNAFLFLYFVFLLSIALFPFDFLISVQEIKWKYETWKAQLLLNVIISIPFIIKTMAEAALFAPIGGFIGVKFQHSSFKKRIALTFLTSFFIAFVIEVLQFFTASGMSQFFSILVRVTGAFSGLFIFKIIILNNFELVKPFLKYIIILIFPVYLGLSLKLSGWFKSEWLDIHEAFLKFDLHMMLPFYFHYFSTETRAVVSILLNFGLYIPVGFSGWLLYSPKKGNKSWYIFMSVFISVALSLFIESGKLFQKGHHPDFTNIIIAAFSATITFKLSDRIFSLLHDAFYE